MDDRSEKEGRVLGGAGTLGAVVDVLCGHGARTAVLALGEVGVDRWSYAELADRVRGLARGLDRAGIGPGHHVGLLCGNSFEWIMACLGMIGAGAVVVPWVRNSMTRRSVTSWRTVVPGWSS